MAFSQFGSVQLVGPEVHAQGPVGLDFPPHFKVAGFLFALAQGEVVTSGTGQASATAWVGRAPTNGLQAGEAIGISVLLLVGPGPAPGLQTLTWSEQVLVE
jgi:hypothetical protein